VRTDYQYFDLLQEKLIFPFKFNQIIYNRLAGAKTHDKKFQFRFVLEILPADNAIPDRDCNFEPDP